MFGSLKKLFRKDMDAGLATSIPETFHSTASPSWASRPDAPATMTFSPEILAPTPSLTGVASSVEIVALPVRSILASLPSTLTSLVQSQGNGFVNLSAKRILQELPKGSVKLPFAEIRHAAPNGTFFDNARFDQMLIELPLAEILSRLHPSLLSRRANQKQTFVSLEVTNIFGPRGQGISISQPERSFKPAPAVGETTNAHDATPTAMPTLAMPIAVPIVSHVPQLRVLPPEPALAGNADRLEIPIAALFEKWPQAIRREIAESDLIQATISFPMDKIEPLLKAGKIIFTWQQICQWMQPRVKNVSAEEDLPLELPLEIVAPLFMAQHRPAKAQKKISMGEIPDLFTNLKTERVAVLKHEITAPVLHLESIAAPPKIKPFVMPVAVESVPAPVEIEPAVAPIQPENPVGEIFGRAEKQDWSPGEIVKNLAAMPDLDGAFIAMQDGLLVAAELPGKFKAETVAAFLPQIFGRMNQYAKELQLGGLSSLAFEAENISWQIVKAEGVYLVVLGKPGRDLPKATLNTIANAVSKQIQ